MSNDFLKELGMKEKTIIAIALILIIYFVVDSSKNMFLGESEVVVKQKSTIKHVDNHKKPKRSNISVNIKGFWNQKYIRNPFFSPAALKEKTITITGIIKKEESKKYKALINNEFYEAGDTVAGFEILDISSNKVKVKSLKTEKTSTVNVF